MLLRRIMTHVKDQNWIAVLLDFLIVVIGVFIGIQAANWNDERQAQGERATSMDRLQTEAELSVEFVRSVVDQYHRTVDARASVLRKAADGSIDAVEQDEIVLAINYLPFFQPVAAPRGVYDEIIGAGQFSNIGDDAVRRAITRYYSQVDNLNSAMVSQRNLSDYLSVWYHPAVRKEFDPDDFTTQTNTFVDAELALEDPIFVKSLQIGHGRQVLAMRQWEYLLTIAEQMCESIATYLERSCAAVNSESVPAEQLN